MRVIIQKTKNIHDQVGCLTPNQLVCTSCCQYYLIQELEKHQGDYCPYQIIGHGCDIHDQFEQPSICRVFHCSKLLEILANPLICDPVVIKHAFQIVESLLLIAGDNGEITR